VVLFLTKTNYTTITSLIRRRATKMHSALSVNLITLVASTLINHISAAALPAQPVLTPRGSCSPAPGPADRRGASAVAQMLIDEANSAADRESGGFLLAMPEYTTVAEYAWQDGEGRSHQTVVQIRILPSAATAGTEPEVHELRQVEIPRRNVYGTVMDLIFGCADHECSSDSCPVGGETVPPSNPVVQVRLAGSAA